MLNKYFISPSFMPSFISSVFLDMLGDLEDSAKYLR